MREITPAMLDQAKEVIRKRVDSMGTSEPLIAPQGSDRILVQIPGLNTGKLDEAREQLYKPAKLDFKLVHPQSDGILSGAVPPDPAFKVETHQERSAPLQIQSKRKLLLGRVGCGQTQRNHKDRKDRTQNPFMPIGISEEVPTE